MTRRALLGGIVAVIAVLATVTVTLANSSHPARTGPPTLAEAQAVLNRHAAAVLERSQSHFMADVDRSPTDAAFREAQLSLFTNLASVPITSWFYQVVLADNTPTDDQSATAMYGAPAQIVKVDFSYALRYVDPGPTSYTLYLTFVRRDGQVKLASDSDLADLAGQSWRGPWEFGPIDTYRGTNSLILAHPDNASAMSAVAAVVDDAVPAVAAVWGGSWNKQVAVVIPDTQAEMNQILNNTLPLSGIAAATYVNGVDASSGDPLGVRIAVNPANLRKLDPIGLRIVIRHEVTLAATWAAKGDAPTWLVEGFAEYVANLGTGQSVQMAAAELTRDIRAGRVPTALPTASQFIGDNPNLPQVYEQSWLACRLIAARAGQAGLVRFFRAVGSSVQGGDQAVDAALHTVMHENTAQFTAAWRAYLTAQLGKV